MSDLLAGELARTRFGWLRAYNLAVGRQVDEANLEIRVRFDVIGRIFDLGIPSGWEDVIVSVKRHNLNWDSQVAIQVPITEAARALSCKAWEAGEECIILVESPLPTPCAVITVHMRYVSGGRLDDAAEPMDRRVSLFALFPELLRLEGLYDRRTNGQ